MCAEEFNITNNSWNGHAGSIKMEKRSEKRRQIKQSRGGISRPSRFTDAFRTKTDRISSKDELLPNIKNRISSYKETIFIVHNGKKSNIAI